MLNYLSKRGCFKVNRWLTYPLLAAKLGLEWPRQRQTLYNLKNKGIFRAAISEVPGMGIRFDEKQVEAIMREHLAAPVDLTSRRRRA